MMQKCLGKNKIWRQSQEILFVKTRKARREEYVGQSTENFSGNELL